MVAALSGLAKMGPRHMKSLLVAEEPTHSSEMISHDLAALHSDADLDRITAFAAKLCEASIALVSLVGPTTQRFVSDHGLGQTETPREWSFCAHAMEGSDIMVVQDATKDARFANNPLVTGEPLIRFYAGAPLRSSHGVPLGSLCVIDRVPRTGLTPLQLDGLKLLADQVMVVFRARKQLKADKDAQAEVESALSETEEKFRILADTMPQMVWSTLPDGFHDYYNARWYEFTGVAAGSTDGEGWNGMFHPDDQELAWTKWRHSLATGEPYEVEYRLRHSSGEYRWTLGRALPMRSHAGEIQRWFGTCTDIHEQKRLLEEREIVSQELSHRIKNIFAVVGGLVGLSSKAHPEIKEIARDLRARIIALGRAHDFVRPHSAKSKPSTVQDSLTGLFETLMAPYVAYERRVLLKGGDAAIDDRSATPLALVFHELATNAAKYGALSEPDGVVEIEIEDRLEDVAITWTERGGPPVEVAPETSGFGSQLIDMSIRNQLGGNMERAWSSDGLVVKAVLPKTSLSRSHC